MGHRLPSYDGLCSSPHGHNMRVEVEIEPKRFLDFKVVSGLLERVLEPFDHAMVLHDKDPLLPILQSMNFRTVSWHEEPTTESIAKFIKQRMSLNWNIVRVTVYETDKYSATERA